MTGRALLGRHLGLCKADAPLEPGDERHHLRTLFVPLAKGADEADYVEYDPERRLLYAPSVLRRPAWQARQPTIDAFLFPPVQAFLAVAARRHARIVVVAEGSVNAPSVARPENEPGRAAPLEGALPVTAHVDSGRMLAPSASTSRRSVACASRPHGFLDLALPEEKRRREETRWALRRLRSA